MGQQLVEEGETGFFQMRGIMACFHADGGKPSREPNKHTSKPDKQTTKQQRWENSWSNILEQEISSSSQCLESLSQAFCMSPPACLRGTGSSSCPWMKSSVFPTHQSDLVQCFLTYISLIHQVAQVRNLDGETLKVALFLIPPSCWRGNSVDPICSTSM